MSGKIYTRRGDQGETSLVGGARIPKSALRVEAYGCVDEANSAVGFARSSLEVAARDEAELDRVLYFAQHRLFNCSSRLATPPDAIGPDTPSISDDDVEVLESAIDRLVEATGEIDHFVLPAGCEEAVRLHLARTVVRRAERAIVRLAEVDEVDPLVLRFVNRLSDLLFAAARYANASYGAGDVFWDPAR